MYKSERGSSFVFCTCWQVILCNYMYNVQPPAAYKLVPASNVCMSVCVCLYV